MTDLAELLLRNARDVFAQRDSLRRMASFKRMWQEGGQFKTVDGIFVGHDEICEYIGASLRSYPEFDFTPTGEINEVAGAAHMRWTIGLVGQQPAFTGADTIQVHDGRIQSVCRFLDGPAC